MKIKSKNEIKNPVFDRRELQLVVESEVSPNSKEMIILIAKEFSVPEDAVKLKGIYGSFGSREFKVGANVYPSKEAKDDTERRTKKEMENEKKEAEALKKAEEEKKKAEEEAKKVEEEKKEEAKVEEKSEEKVEEVKEEVKPEEKVDEVKEEIKEEKKE